MVVVQEVTPGPCTVRLSTTVENSRKMFGCRWLLLAPLLSDPLSDFGDMQFGWLDEFQL